MKMLKHIGTALLGSIILTCTALLFPAAVLVRCLYFAAVTFCSVAREEFAPDELRRFWDGYRAMWTR
jgi:hypothetical protein